MKNSIFTILLSLCFLTILVGQQRELSVTEMNSDNDAVIEIKGENANATDYMRMELGFNQSNHTWLRTLTDHDLSFWTMDKKRFTIKNDGKVGIGTSSPTQALQVVGNTIIDGSLQQIGSGNTIIESTTGTITIRSGSAVVEIGPNGNINIISQNNLTVNTGGTFNLNADEIIMTANNNIEMTSGKNIKMTSADNVTVVASQAMNIQTGLNIEMTSGENIEMTSSDNVAVVANQDIEFQTGQNINLQANQNMNLQANKTQSITALNYVSTIQNNSSNTIGGNYSLASTIVNMDANPIRLNAGTLGAARKSDTTNSTCILKGDKDHDCTGQIISSSNSVLIGN